jgi:tyrosinase
MPSDADVEAVKARDRFTPFQLALETGPHNAAHRAIGGDMVTTASPTDPIFYMHHANVDRIWYEWQEHHLAQNPPNMAEVLQPTLVSVPVSSVVDRSNLPYSYA